jgi:hypothetical protein
MPLVVHHHGWRAEPSLPAPEATDQRACAELQAVVEEAIRLQQLAQTLLDELHAQASQPELSRRGASLMSQFVRLRRQLPRSRDASVRRYVEIVDTVLDQHARHLSAALERTTSHSRPEPIIEPPAADGLGHPAQWLETVRGQLARLRCDSGGSQATPPPLDVRTEHRR